MHCTTPSAIIHDRTMNDAKFISHHANDPHIAANMRDTCPHPYTLKEAKKFFAMATEKQAAIVLAIEVDHDAIGGIGIHPLGPSRDC